MTDAAIPPALLGLVDAATRDITDSDLSFYTENLQEARFSLLVAPSVTFLAQLTPTVYSMSSRARTPKAPLIPSNTIWRHKRNG